MIVNTFRRIALAHELLPAAAWQKAEDDRPLPAPAAAEGQEPRGQQRSPAEAGV